MVNYAMAASSRSRHGIPQGPSWQTPHDIQALLRGEILTHPSPYGLTGGAVTASIHLPQPVQQLWPWLTDYPRWVEYFPNITHSEEVPASRPGTRCLYQTGRKDFLMLAAEVEIYLQVYERVQQRILFCMERGSFEDFSAELSLQPYQSGTLLHYTVRAKPLIPVPSLLIEQGMKKELPENMAQMRQVLCA